MFFPSNCSLDAPGGVAVRGFFSILGWMQMELRQYPEPSPPPIKEPPDGPENPNVPVQEPDPEEPFQI
jgi:hypothetical protein